MPKSGIGRAIVLGIILGILLVFAVGVAGAQEREPVRALEGKLCYVDGELGAWLAGTKSIPPANIPAAVRARIGAIGGALEGLCAAEERLASADDRERLGWLLRADSQCEYLSDTLREALEAPQTTASRRHLAKLASHAAHLQSVVREFRFLHGYSRVEVREKEVMKTVQVPVAAQCPRCPDLVCPEAPVCPQGPSQAEMEQQYRQERRERCDATLRGGVASWYRDLGRLASAAPSWDASGAVGRIASSITECMDWGRMRAEGCTETLPARVEAWRAQLVEAIRADDRAERKASSIIRPQLDSIEADMESRLRSCGDRRR